MLNFFPFPRYYQIFETILEQDGVSIGHTKVKFHLQYNSSKASKTPRFSLSSSVLEVAKDKFHRHCIPFKKFFLCIQLTSIPNN